MAEIQSSVCVWECPVTRHPKTWLSATFERKVVGMMRRWVKMLQTMLSLPSERLLSPHHPVSGGREGRWLRRDCGSTGFRLPPLFSSFSPQTGWWDDGITDRFLIPGPDSFRILLRHNSSCVTTWVRSTLKTKHSRFYRFPSLFHLDASSRILPNFLLFPINEQYWHMENHIANLGQSAAFPFKIGGEKSRMIDYDDYDVRRNVVVNHDRKY